jgi:hypothetical protein
MFETLGNILTLLGFLLLALFVWLAFSPFETLGWWAGWFSDTIYDDPNPPDEQIYTLSNQADSYIIFLSGVGRVSGESISFREQDFLQRLDKALPQAVLVDDIFPYSVNNLPITAQPYFGWLWRWALRRKRNGPQIMGYLINLRNIFQILVSADRRYGPVINQGLAEVLLFGLLRHHYNPQSKLPIFLIGYSGAGQMAVGPARYLKEWLQTPIYVISLGGVFSSDPSLLSVDQLFHIVGDNDTIERYRLIDASNWPVFATSEWNRAVRQGRITHVHIGPMGHTGLGGYLDAKSELPDGTKYVDKTVKTIAEIVRSQVQKPQEALTAADQAGRSLENGKKDSSSLDFPA